MPLNRLEIAKRIAKEHENLNKQMAKIKSAIMQEVTSENFSDWRLDFIWQLRDFNNELLKHFDLEEEGGFMAEVLKVAPHTEHKVQALKDEHKKIIADVDKLLAELKSVSEKNAEKMSHIRTSINEIIMVLHSHESAENQLMQKAYYREYGGPA